MLLFPASFRSSADGTAAARSSLETSAHPLAALEQNYTGYRYSGRTLAAGYGPTLPSPASAWNGSYLGISCRQRRCGTTGENDPKLPSHSPNLWMVRHAACPAAICFDNRGKVCKAANAQLSGSPALRSPSRRCSTSLGSLWSARPGESGQQ